MFIWQQTILAAVIAAVITPKPTFVTNEYVARQYGFYNNDAIDAITERRAILTSGATIVDNKLSFGGSNAYMKGHTWQIPAGDFTIELAYSGADPTSTADTDFIGVWDGSANQSLWCFGWNRASSKFSFRAVTATGGTDTLYSNTMALPVNAHIAIVRKSGTVTMYVNGTAVGTSTAFTTVHNAVVVADYGLRVATNNTTFPGKIWNIRLSRTSQYSDTFTAPTSFPLMTRPVYDTVTASKIVAQFGFRYDNLLNEVNDTQMSLYGGSVTTVANGAVGVSSGSNTNYFAFPINPFGAADFTIEFTANVSSVSSQGGLTIMTQFVNGSASNNCAWSITILQDGRIQMLISTTGAGTGSGIKYVISATGAYKFNVPQHVVIQRIGSTCTIYINSVSVISGAMAGAMASSNLPVRSIYDSGAGYGVFTAWDIRIASMALYPSGTIVRPLTLPAMPVENTWQFRFIDGQVTYAPITYTGYDVVAASGADRTGYTDPRFNQYAYHAGTKEVRQMSLMRQNYNNIPTLIMSYRVVPASEYAGRSISDPTLLPAFTTTVKVRGLSTNFMVPATFTQVNGQGLKYAEGSITAASFTALGAGTKNTMYWSFV